MTDYPDITVVPEGGTVEHTVPPQSWYVEKYEGQWHVGYHHGPEQTGLMPYSGHDSKAEALEAAAEAKAQE